MWSFTLVQDHSLYYSIFLWRSSQNPAPLAVVWHNFPVGLQNLPLIRIIHLLAVLTLIVNASATSRTPATGVPPGECSCLSQRVEREDSPRTEQEYEVLVNEIDDNHAN